MRAGAYPGPWTALGGGRRRGAAGTLAGVSDEPVEPLPKQQSPEDLTPIRAQVYRDPRPSEIFDRFHTRARTRRPDLAYEVVRVFTSTYAWGVFFGTGEVSYGVKSSTNAVRAVRGGL